MAVVDVLVLALELVLVHLTCMEMGLVRLIQADLDRDLKAKGKRREARGYGKFGKGGKGYDDVDYYDSGEGKGYSGESSPSKGSNCYYS